MVGSDQPSTTPKGEAMGHTRFEFGEYLAVVEAATSKLEGFQVVPRVWDKDPSVWKQDLEHVENSLGWLDLPESMREQVPALKVFAQEICDAGFQHVVVLGMGGSSLASAALRQAFGISHKYPELLVLDSTVPVWVEAVAAYIDPAKTLFLVSSKSGTTVEPLAQYRHFLNLVEQAVGLENAGRSFVAITDPGTELERLAHEKGFRTVFLNRPDVGGRYSALSLFGLVPAALMGIDIAVLLESGAQMRALCGPHVTAHKNPGAWLGAVIGSLSLLGRNKLTLITSPSLNGFGLWVEQLIAESTGKGGKGVVPIASEPLVSADLYGEDRLFIYIRLEGDGSASADAFVGRMISSRAPVVCIDLKDISDLGAEFFRWQFATSIASSFLEVNPFDQPSVQESKDLAKLVLQEHIISGKPPLAETKGSPAELLSSARRGDYLALMVYLWQTPDLDKELSELRRIVLRLYRIPTTLGYGPRFLHSTGQLHKGGPESVLFLQLTTNHDADTVGQKEPSLLGALTNAQAASDLRVLEGLGRRVARINLGPDAVGEIRELGRHLMESMGSGVAQNT